MASVSVATKKVWETTSNTSKTIGETTIPRDKKTLATITDTIDIVNENKYPVKIFINGGFFFEINKVITIINA